jgi:malate/lactate dehydrogenase
VSLLCYPQSEQFSKADLVLITQTEGKVSETDKFEALQMCPKRRETVQDKLIFVCANTSLSVIGNNVDFIVY